MKNYLVQCILGLSWLVCAGQSVAQPTDVSLKIKSEQKLIHSDSGMFKSSADDIYFDKSEQLKKAITDWLRKRVKDLSGQTMHSDAILLSHSRMELYNGYNGEIYLHYRLPSNKISFRVTTPDVMGIGQSREKDPDVTIFFGVMASFKIIQNGTVESIRILNPEWHIAKPKSEGHNIENSGIKTKFDKYDLNIISGEMIREFRNFYASMNNINEKLDEYINTWIKNNPDLLKEFSIDENKNLKVVADVTKGELIFQHIYSQAGMVKRTATTEAKTVKEGPKSTSTSTVPTSTSASEIKKKTSATSTSVPVKKN